MAAGWTHVCLVLAGLGWGAEAGQSYRGHQVVRARLETAAQAQLLAEAAELEQLDLWTRAGAGRGLDIRVAPHQNTSLARLLDTAGVQYRQTCQRCLNKDISLCLTIIRMKSMKLNNI